MRATPNIPSTIRLFALAVLAAVGFLAASAPGSDAATISQRIALGIERTSTETGSWNAVSELLQGRQPTDVPAVDLVDATPTINDECGVSTIWGDLNGDGRKDAIVGCPSSDPGGVAGLGSALVFMRNAANTGFDVPVEVTHAAGLTTDRCADFVDVGDVNADGRDDIVLGCPSADPSGQVGAGIAVVITRNAANTGFDPSVTITAPVPAGGQNCGTAIAVGDYDADGFADVAMGCYTATAGGQATAGLLHVFLRNATNNGFDAPETLQRTTPSATDNCADDLEAGDINGDDRDDIVMGCRRADAGAVSDAGAAVVFIRNAGNTAFNAGVELNRPGAAASDMCTDVSLGDATGDGRQDVLLGCSNADPAGQATAGSAVVFVRDAANTGFKAGVELTRAVPVAGDRCGGEIGMSTAMADVTGDGRADALVGCSQADVGGVNTGVTLVFERNRHNTAFLPAVEFQRQAPVAGDLCGHVTAGDANGDGRAEVSGSCVDTTVGGQTRAGLTYVREFSASGIEPTVFETGFQRYQSELTSVGGAANYCGESVAGGDFNADGRMDVLLGCWGQNVGGTLEAGEVGIGLRNPNNDGFVVTLRRGHSNSTPDRCGWSVDAGDLNGDGRDDIVAGCPKRDVAAQVDSGSVMILTRNSANTDFDPFVIVDGASPSGNRNCGSGVAVGDFNADGHGDLLVGCWGESWGVAESGEMQVMLRNSANTGFDAAIRLGNVASGISSRCGWSVTAADVNGDGLDDAVMGCPNDDTVANDAGAMIVYERNSTNTGFNAGVRLTNDAAGGAANALDLCGYSVAAGDVNGDGKDDLAMGCRGEDVAGVESVGEMHVRLRNVSNNGFDTGIRLSNPSGVADYCGHAVGLGDVDGDGLDDATLGCFNADTGAADAGVVRVFPRAADNSGFLGSTVLANPSPVANDNCGQSLAMADVHGDGRDDILTGCWRDDTTAADAGSGVVFTWQPSSLVTYAPAAASDECGRSTTVADFDGDGYGDVAMSCHLVDAGSWDESGNAVVYLRDSTNTSFDAAVTLLATSTTHNEHCGYALAAGTINANANADLVLGCPDADTGAVDSGRATVLMRNTANNGFDAAVNLADPAPGASDQCGRSVAIGDVNGDHKSDVLVGCTGDNTGAADAGNALLYVRNTADNGFDAAVALVNPSPAASDGCGRSVGIADVNGDGNGDVVIGCQLDDTSAADAGSVVIYERNTTNDGFDPAVELANVAPTTGDNCGVSLATGDVDGDAHDDIVLGCLQNDTGATDAGKALVFVRNAANNGWIGGVNLTNPAAALNDHCGYSTRIADLDSDGRGDVLMGCDLDDAGGADAGATVVFTRNPTNTGFAAGKVWQNTVAGQKCGNSIGVGDINADGRTDVAVGCIGYSSSRGASRTYINQSRVPFVTDQHVASSRMNANGLTVLAATVTPDVVDNGQETPAWEVSANGGASWEAASPGVAHPFSRRGKDLRFRVGTANAAARHRSAVVHEVHLSYDFNTPPVAPALVTPVAASVTTDTTPPLVATFSDPIDASDTGTLEFEVCSNATCTGGSDPLRTGSSASGITNGANGTWTVGGALPVGLFHWRARAVDNIDDAGPWSATQTLRIDTAPNIPTHVSPAAGASVVPGSPTFTGNFTDPDADTGRLRFEVCTDAACASPVGTLSPAAYVASGANQSSSTLPLTAGTYYWRIYGQDVHGVNGSWSATRLLYVAAAAPSGLYTHDSNASAGTTNATGITSAIPHFSWNNNAGVQVDRQRVRVVSTMLTGVVAGWHFDGAFTDYSGNGHTQTPSAPANDPSFDGTDVIPGFSQSLAFDGNDAASAPHAAALDLDTFTIDTWVKVDALNPGGGAYSSIVNKSGNPLNRNFQLAVDSTTGVPIASLSAGGVAHSVSGTTNLVGGWHHLVMVVNSAPADPGKTLELYVDGVREANTTFSGNVDNAFAATCIGSACAGTSLGLIGKIDDLQIGAGAATQAHVVGYYRARVPHNQLMWDSDPGDAGIAMAACNDTVRCADVVYGSTGSVPLALERQGARYYVESKFKTTAAPTWSQWSALDWFETALSLTITVPSGAAETLGAGTIFPGTNATASSDVVVTTNNASGYTLSAKGPSDTWGLQSGADNLPAWTGLPGTPTTWAAGTSGYFGLSVLSAAGGKDTGRWGTGTLETDYATLKYAGLTLTSSSTLHTKSGPAPGGDTTVTAYRVNPGASQAPGSYAGTITYTAIALP